MGIKTLKNNTLTTSVAPLKNLPTTWGLRHNATNFSDISYTLKNLPTTWGLRRFKNAWCT